MSAPRNQHANGKDLDAWRAVGPSVGLLCVFRRAKFPADLGREAPPRGLRRRRFNVDFQLRADYGLDHRAGGGTGLTGVLQDWESTSQVW